MRSALPVASQRFLQVGAWGGCPDSGLKFGTAHNAAALVPTATMFDFYDGGGIDLACVGLAEVSGMAAPPYCALCSRVCCSPDWESCEGL